METKKDGKSIGGNGENWSEARLQSECFQYHWGAYQNERGLLHANNNNSHNKIKGNINKALGVVEGVADMEYVGLNCMYFIEMKLPGQKQSKAQIDFQDKVTRLGHEYLIIEYLDAFKLLCRDMRNGLRVYDSDHYNRLVRLGMYYL